MPNESANPLLLGWLKEWWDDAREKNSKGVLTYRKAYESMKACPIVFNHPSEAIQLHGLGPKLCDRLTANLEKHCRDLGLPMPEKPHKAQKRMSDQGAEDDAPAKKPRKTKPYVPTLRSGPYAILMALSTLPESSPNGMTKNELIEQAQPHCDSSFTAPSDPTKFYTAWNSMKTLAGKDLVYEFGRPTKRYALTEEGWEAAKRIKKVDVSSAGLFTSQDAVEEVEPAVREGPAASKARKTNASKDKNASAKTSGKLASSNEGADSVPARSAQVSILTNPSQGSASGFRPPASFQRIDVIELDDSDDETVNCVPDLPSIPRPSTCATVKRTSGLARSASDVVNNNSSQLLAPPRLDRAPSAPPNVHSSPPASPRRFRVAMDSSFQPIHIPAGTFTVELVLDNREVRAKTDRDYIQNTLVGHGVSPVTRGLPLGDALWIARLKPEHARLLSDAGEDGKPDEILLSHIMERKRLDDLIGSIKDGRFHEQKFRLRRSGVPNVTYLVEEIALSQDTPQRTFDMIASAIAGTMTVGGFFVKRTRKLDDSIAYLARMTKLLRKKFEGKDLNIIPSRALGDGRDVQRIKGLLKGEAHFLTFEAFSGMAGKNDSLTLRDVFLKMLMCTRGITGDKAMEMQRRWKTPKEFVEALEKEERDGDEKKRKEMVFRAAGQLVGRRQIGKAVSTRVCDVWGES